jgi:hypothetical protein
MKAVTKRLLRLEVRFGWTAAVPSVDEEIFERLVAGEWQSALKLLEPRERELWKARQSIEYGGAGPKERIDLMGLTRLRQTLSSSLAGLPPEKRIDIARQLLAADTEDRGMP